jgi:hypothetical protein
MAAHTIEVFVWALAYLIFGAAPELRDTGLWRRASGGTLAAAWPSYRNEWHVAIWMVDRSYFRGPTANVSAYPRYQ